MGLGIREKQFQGNVNVTNDSNVSLFQKKMRLLLHEFLFGFVQVLILRASEQVCLRGIGFLLPHLLIYRDIHKYVHTYIHTYMHACIHTYIHSYIHTYIHAYIHTFIHTYIHTHTLTQSSRFPTLVIQH